MNKSMTATIQSILQEGPQVGFCSLINYQIASMYEINPSEPTFWTYLFQGPFRFDMRIMRPYLGTINRSTSLDKGKVDQNTPISWQKPRALGGYPQDFAAATDPYWPWIWLEIGRYMVDKEMA